VEAAERDAVEADRLLAAAGTAPAWLIFETRLWLARTRLRLSDAAAGQGLLRLARRSARELEGSPVAPEWLEDAAARARAFSGGAAPTLTPAELRILRFLPSHLSFREIGERVFVSTNTVKTQALAVYRKLDVGSRSAAVERARALDLLDA
jgi:LuxR family transcriptional regulator, maltose regulon positive regulatory protein